MSSSETIQGEDSATSNPTDARRWLSIYSELVGFEEDMLRRIHERMATLSASARYEAERSNLPQLESDCRRFRDRLAFWEGRVAEIAAAAES
jgi:hypothetical protein